MYERGNNQIWETQPESLVTPIQRNTSMRTSFSLTQWLTSGCPDCSLHRNNYIQDQHQVQEVGDSKQSPPAGSRAAVWDVVVEEREAGLVGVDQAYEDDGCGQDHVPSHAELCTREHRVSLPPLPDSEDRPYQFRGERERILPAVNLYIYPIFPINHMKDHTIHKNSGMPRATEQQPTIQVVIYLGLTH